MLVARICISPEHPSLVDHFPGHPIAPGVVTLDYIAQSLLKAQPNKYLLGFPQVKFMKPVLPSMELDVTYINKSDSLYQFKCEHNGDTLLLGQILLGQKESVLV